MTNQQSSPRVFISYSHDSEEHQQRVHALAVQLVRDGIDVQIDLWVDGGAPEKGWPQWMEKEIDSADFVLVVSTETYRRRYRKDEAAGQGRGVTWEGGIIDQALYEAQGRNTKFIPVAFTADDLEFVPRPLRSTSHYLVDTEGNYRDLYARLTDQHPNPKPKLGRIRQLEIQKSPSLFGDHSPLSPADQGLLDTLDPKILAYRDWAMERYRCLELIGMNAGQITVDLEKVWVPLRVADRGFGRMGFEGHPEDPIPPGARTEPIGDPNIVIEEVLDHGESRHALIFGEPGSGKTTALLKLQQLCWGRKLRLDEGIVPVFLRLRRLTPQLLQDGWPAFLESEVNESSGERLPGIGKALWEYGRLLLLFDGLDEIADSGHRTEVLLSIAWAMGQTAAQGMRAVVSCRRIGLPKLEVNREQRFRTFEVRPLQNDQIETLVTQWFRELVRHKQIGNEMAKRRVSRILDALRDPTYANQQILSIVSNPLLLTLLCVVVLNGDEIPKRRIRFYEQCLDILLDRWPRHRGRESPVDPQLGRRAIEAVAFQLHLEKRRDNLSWAEAVAALKTVLGDRRLSIQHFKWLHGEVGLLVDHTEEAYGFVHLGIQEHLAAHHLANHPEALNFLIDGFEESWWTEVFLQLAAVSSEGFKALLSALLEHTDILERRATLLRECLQEALHPDLTPFMEVLQAGTPVRQESALRLLRDFGPLPDALLAQAESLRAAAEPRVRTAAHHLVERTHSRVEPLSTECVGVIYDHASDRDFGLRLVQALGDWCGGLAAPLTRGLGPATGEMIEGCELVVVILGPTAGPWTGASSFLNLYQSEDCRWVAVRLPGEQRPPIPDAFGDLPFVDWESGGLDRLRETIVGYLPLEAHLGSFRGVGVAPEDSPEHGGGLSFDEPYADPVSGEVFLPVPGGRFLMGSDRFDSEKPIHPVRLSPYWFARTPVTNAQYGRFFQEAGHREPENWRDRRFSAPNQPVVGVSWEDAVAYCEWLTEQNPDGYRFELPSEAQWEFAARGDDGRTYPWGSEGPTSELACFDLDVTKGKPAIVGSFPDGVGPFGHLDLAGGVWEWCRDFWEPDYSRWQGSEPLDPVGKADADLRSLRGGCWWSVAVYLRSALRDRDWPRNRGGSVGFRVLCGPPSTDE